MTLIGWITLLRGIALLPLPAEANRKVLAALKRERTFYAAGIAAIFGGIWLSYAGFSRKRARLAKDCRASTLA